MGDIKIIIEINQSKQILEPKYQEKNTNKIKKVPVGIREEDEQGNDGEQQETLLEKDPIIKDFIFAFRNQTQIKLYFI